MIRIDDASAEPPFEQVKRQFREAVTTGELQPGDKLPTVRRLADDLGLAPNTVARAYRELEQQGVVATRGRAGTFVSGDDTRRAARSATVAYLEQMRGLGLSPAEVLDLVRQTSRAPQDGHSDR